MKEEWRSIVGFDRYEVSSLGAVRSYCRRNMRILAAHPNGCGYLQVTLVTPSGLKCPRRVHRLVATAFCANPGNKRTVNHIDGVRANNICSNLEWCTQAENNLHSFRSNGRKGSGTRGSTARLTDQQAREIRESLRFAPPSYKAKLARELGVNIKTITRLAAGITYRDLLEAPDAV